VAWIEQLIGRRPQKRPASKGDPGEPRLRTLAEQILTSRGVPAGPHLPVFKSAASRQSDGRGNPFDEIRVRLYSAFAASQPVTDRRCFAGRTEVLEKLIRATEDLRLHTVLYGERGLGKTSIMHMLAQAARDARYIAIYISCGGRSTFDEVIRLVAAQIPLLYCRGVSPVSPEIESGRTFADLLPAGRLSPQTASETLSSIVGTRVLVILDEFDQCQSKDFRLSIAELLKSLSDKGAFLQFLIAGVGANLTELIEHLPSIQRNVFGLQLQRMSLAELRDLIRNGEAVTGLKFEPAAETGIVEVANGFPYFACLLSCYAGLRALDEQRSSVTIDDVLRATFEAVEQFGGRLSQQSRYEIAEFESTKLELLGSLAGAAQMSGGCFSLGDIQMLFRKERGTEQCKDFIDNLARSGIILPPENGTNLDVFRFRDETAIPYIWFCSALKRLQWQASSTFETDTVLKSRSDVPG